MAHSNYYLPRCKTCGALEPPTTLEKAIEACNMHRFAHKTHKTVWVPIKYKRQNKEQTK